MGGLAALLVLMGGAAASPAAAPYHCYASAYYLEREAWLSPVWSQADPDAVTTVLAERFLTRVLEASPRLPREVITNRRCLPPEDGAFGCAVNSASFSSLVTCGRSLSEIEEAVADDRKAYKAFDLPRPVIGAP